MVAYRRWLFTRGYHCKALAGEILVFWIGGHLWEVVAFKNRITGGLFQEEVWALLLNAISKLHHVYFQVHVVYSK